MGRGAWWATVYRLTCIADAHCILVREGGGQIDTQNFMSNFSCPVFKYKFYLITWNQGQKNIIQKSSKKQAKFIKKRILKNEEHVRTSSRMKPMFPEGKE